MNETYDKLIDIIAVDIKLAIELIKGQNIDVKEFVDYITDDIKLKDLSIQNVIIEYIDWRPGVNTSLPDIKSSITYINFCSIDYFKELLSKHLNKLKNE